VPLSTLTFRTYLRIVLSVSTLHPFMTAPLAAVAIECYFDSVNRDNNSIEVIRKRTAVQDPIAKVAVPEGGY
jgi:hypothetical protein